jgi:signal transduction histidine kinase
MNFTIVMVIGMIILTYYSKQVSHSEKELREKNIELEKANVELDRFVYSASHDLRAPISSLLGLIQLYHLSPQHEKDKMVSLMESRVRKLDEFVREIIQYSRNARQEMNLSLIRPFELVNGCWERLRFMPQKIKIQFINETDPLLQINHDADRLRMIIENLVSNGIKYAKARPEPSFISVAVFENDNQLHITVADNGIGIEKTKREKVFEMFYRAHEISDGSGLGLYIVKEMVIKMQGQIELTSEEVQGTTFKIRLPLIKTNDVPEQEAIHEN